MPKFEISSWCCAVSKFQISSWSCAIYVDGPLSYILKATQKRNQLAAFAPDWYSACVSPPSTEAPQSHSPIDQTRHAARERDRYCRHSPPSWRSTGTFHRCVGHNPPQKQVVGQQEPPSWRSIYTIVDASAIFRPKNSSVSRNRRYRPYGSFGTGSAKEVWSSLRSNPRLQTPTRIGDLKLFPNESCHVVGTRRSYLKQKGEPAPHQ